LEACATSEKYIDFDLIFETLEDEIERVKRTQLLRGAEN
jgi:hypothetical protein